MSAERLSEEELSELERLRRKAADSGGGYTVDKDDACHAAYDALPSLLSEVRESREKLNKPCANCGFPTDDLLGVSKLRAAALMAKTIEGMEHYPTCKVWVSKGVKSPCLCGKDAALAAWRAAGGGT